MSYEHIFQSQVECSQELTPNEAIFAIGMMVMVVDGEVDNNEVEILEGFLFRKGLNAYQIDEARKKVLDILHEEREPALFNAAKKALPEPLQIETAFDLAVKVALADNKVTAEEKSFVIGLARGLSLSQESLDKILEKAIKKHYSKTTAMEKIAEILSSLPVGTQYEGFSRSKTESSFYNIKLRTPDGHLFILNIDEGEDEHQLDIDMEAAPPWMV